MELTIYYCSALCETKIVFALDLLQSFIHVFQTKLKEEWSGIQPGCKIWVGSVTTLKEQCPLGTICILQTVVKRENLSKFSTVQAYVDSLPLFLMQCPSLFSPTFFCLGYALCQILVLNNSVKKYIRHQTQTQN